MQTKITAERGGGAVKIIARRERTGARISVTWELLPFSLTGVVQDEPI
jgi:hypothetical protein